MSVAGEFRERAGVNAGMIVLGTDANGWGHEPRSLLSAIHARAGANLALISVPGEFAAREAATALQAGLHAMVFSDNVSLADEIALKELDPGRRHRLPAYSSTLPPESLRDGIGVRQP